MNDQEQPTPSVKDEAAAAVWAGYDPELQAAVIAGDPLAERVYRAESEVEELRRKEEAQP